MQHITDFNPWLPDTQQVIPAREGGNGPNPPTRPVSECDLANPGTCTRRV
ncbi:Uncharacterised protein [Serratia fonticola]|uniref:Uncharacterized protein n=1 Tax=Serratia fonticola TaxID=47917 RepID=A0A4U9WDS7_SERFO|nr:Uncharacterised protein [Serratia fonticola]